uniref:Uncharacterized protein n=1 Tax=Anguilla anguilla TaxID=7936 RepID=A0A0E9SHH2_ANGAN
MEQLARSRNRRHLGIFETRRKIAHHRLSTGEKHNEHNYFISEVFLTSLCYQIHIY